jgi:DNA repair exonuclease SbcCD ATPase subunit
MYIKGVGMTKFDYSTKPWWQFAYEAAIEALKDAKIDMSDIDAIVFASVSAAAGGEHQTHKVSFLSDLFKTNIPIIEVTSVCGGGGVAFWTALQLQQFNNVLVLASEKFGDNKSETVTDWILSAAEKIIEQTEGMLFPTQNALIWQKYMKKYNATMDDLSLIAFKNHSNAALNPKAYFYKKPIELEKVKNSPVVSSPKKEKIYKDELQLTELSSKIEIFKGGICPLCKTKLKENSHITELDVMNESHLELSSEILELKRSFKQLKEDVYSNIEEKRKLTVERDEKRIEFDSIKNEIKNLRTQYEQNTELVSIDEINKNIKEIEIDNEKYNQALIKINSKLVSYEKLIDILSEKGIRKNIITNLVNPINEHLSKYLMGLESKYSVKLNDEFDAIIKENYFEDIHIESLSTGEARKINIAIALSYTETILSMSKKTNILFMDEVFASVDPENIDTMLKVVRDFSTKNNINIIVVNHSNLDTTKFDRVINVEKVLGFSTIFEKI